MRQLRSNAICWITLLLIGCYVPNARAQEADFKCYQCDSTTDAKCISDVTKTPLVDCSTDKSCFTEIATGKVSRGCRAKTPENCVEPNCYACNKTQCNTNTICKACDSAEDCAKTDVQAETFNQVCPSAETKCFARVKADNSVERRCATDQDLKDCPADTGTCKTCSAPNCNEGIFPANRRRCYQCTDCPNVVNNDSTPPKPCLVYNDKCYMYGTSESTMMRGCVSDKDAQNKCQNPESNALCLACEADNCNDSGFKYAQTLKCIQCGGGADDKDCMWGQPVLSAKNCDKTIPYNVKGECYIQVKDNNVTQRGCLYDRADTADWCTKESGCERCGTTDGCNNKDVIDFTCIRCRSDENELCWNDAEKVTGTQCRNAVTQGTQGCFRGVWNDVAIRGCLVDVDDRVNYICKDKNNKQCTACEEKNCNTQKSSGAASMAVTTTVVLLAAVLLSLVS